MEGGRSARVGTKPGTRFVVVLHRVRSAALVLAAGSPAATSWATAAPDAPPRAVLSAAQRRRIHRPCAAAARGSSAEVAQTRWRLIVQLCTVVCNPKY
eukprot:scaffold82144_cov83-Phaeocystis_antarctica.AAC.1